MPLEEDHGPPVREEPGAARLHLVHGPHAGKGPGNFRKRLQLTGIDPAPLAAKYPSIVSQTRGGYLGGAAEYQRLATAEQIDAGAAYESASWGAFQVMAYHWKRLGYAGVDDFVARMESGEAEQLEAFVRYVAADPALVAALKARKWAAFAKGYNGENYAANLYDVKLARAFDRYSQAVPA